MDQYFLTYDQIQQLGPGDIARWLDNVRYMRDALGPIKCRKGRKPDFRTGMQDEFIKERLQLSMMETDLIERARVERLGATGG